MTDVQPADRPITELCRSCRPSKRTHGIPSTYHNGCRCVPCRAAATAYRRQYRARKKAGG